jgi:hypothetical protein
MYGKQYELIEFDLANICVESMIEAAKFTTSTFFRCCAEDPGP